MDNLNQKKWFVYLQDHHEGPFSLDEVRQFIQSGKATPASFFWAEGMADWKVITEIPELAPALEPEGASSSQEHEDMSEDTEIRPTSELQRSQDAAVDESITEGPLEPIMAPETDIGMGGDGELPIESGDTAPAIENEVQPIPSKDDVSPDSVAPVEEQPAYSDQPASIASDFSQNAGGVAPGMEQPTPQADAPLASPQPANTGTVPQNQSQFASEVGPADLNPTLNPPESANQQLPQGNPFAGAEETDAKTLELKVTPEVLRQMVSRGGAQSPNPNPAPQLNPGAKVNPAPTVNPAPSITPSLADPGPAAPSTPDFGSSPVRGSERVEIERRPRIPMSQPGMASSADPNKKNGFEDGPRTILHGRQESGLHV